MRQISTFLFFVFGFLPFCSKAQEALNNDLNLAYLVHQPTIHSAHPPIIILMHGYGSNEADLFDLKDALPANFLIISVRAPLAMGDNSFQWFRNETVNGISQGNRADLKSSAAMVKAFIPVIVRKYSADAGQVYLSGFSQGAMMSYEVGLTAPQLLRGIAPMSGRIFPSLKPQIKATAALKHLKVFIGHGDADNRVAYHFATEAHTYLKSLGLNPELHMYKGMQHSINQDELKDLVRWITGK